MKRKKSKQPTKRDVMRSNNDIAREWLIEKGFVEIWLKQHNRFLDTVWKQNNSSSGLQILKYKAQDMYNCFDGIAWLKGKLTFLCIGMEFKKEEVIEDFIKDKNGFDVLMIKVSPFTRNVTTKEWKK